MLMLMQYTPQAACKESSDRNVFVMEISDLRRNLTVSLGAHVGYTPVSVYIYGCLEGPDHVYLGPCQAPRYWAWGNGPNGALT